jgi:ADP-heptose:LPS heptosyltransferase
MKVIIGLIEHLGDIVACEPVARYAKARFPTATLSWAVSKPFRELIDSNPYIDETIVLDCLTDWIRITKHGSYDHVIDLHVNYRVCQHCKVPLFKTTGNPFVNVYEWFDYGAILEAFSVGAGLPRLIAQPQLYLNAEHRDAVDKLGITGEYCVIHRKSNDVIKDWKDPLWDNLIAWITKEWGLKVVEVGGKLAEDDVAQTAEVVNLSGKTSILQTAEIINRARLFIGVDSGPAHIANAVQTSGVVLLGQIGHFKKYNPYTGFYASESNDVRLVRNLVGSASELGLREVVEAINYVLKVGSNRRHLSYDEVPNQPRNKANKNDRSDNKKIILSSGLFDAAWYLTQYPDVDHTKIDPLTHFLTIGADEGRQPSPGFDTKWYLTQNKDVAESKLNPLVHYILWGKQEGRQPHQRAPEPKPTTFTDVELGRYICEEETTTLDHSTSLGNASIQFPRVFAFYLSQYHPIQENNWAYGMGFTEWHNVIKTKPLFKGHYQPRIPGELGFYDLRAEETIYNQIELASSHGINGFCFYYYYFHGKRLLHKPLDIFLKSKINFPFFFLWANENWSKRWDGGDHEIIVEQNHSKEDDLHFIRELLPIFEDERYVKINGKPVLMIYKSHLFPDVSRSIETWHAVAQSHGYPGLYLIMVDDWFQTPIVPRTLGFDASYEVPSNITHKEVLVNDQEQFDFNGEFHGSIVDYHKFASFHLGRPFPEYKRFRTVMLPWDNTARYGSKAIVHVNANNDAFKVWLAAAYIDTYKRYAADERIMFIHSWNEWCEGTYLEPDGKFGRRYLTETRDTIQAAKESIVLSESSGADAKLINFTQRIEKERQEGAYRAVQIAQTRTWEFAAELDKTRSELDRVRLELQRLRSRLRFLTPLFQLYRRWYRHLGA